MRIWFCVQKTQMAFEKKYQIKPAKWPRFWQKLQRPTVREGAVPLTTVFLGFNSFSLPH